MPITSHATSVSPTAGSRVALENDVIIILRDFTVQTVS